MNLDACDQWLAWWKSHPPVKQPEPVLSPAQQWDLYQKAREAYEAGTVSLEVMTAAITPDVAELIAATEAEEARERAARKALDPPVNVVALAFMVGIVAMVLFGAILAALGTVHHQRYPTTANCTTGTCTNDWQDPPMHWQLLGPGMLTTMVGGKQETFHVMDLFEYTNGPETALPVHYFTKNGEQTVTGWFWFVPEAWPGGGEI